jgi:tRNA(Ile2) C34 agmatinyltransferase TiaS
MRNGPIFAARWAAMLAFAASSVPALAHHNYALYERCRHVSLEGEIASIQWTNPHVLIDLKTGDAETYRIEWAALQQLAQAHVSTDALKVGDHVVIVGSVMRDPERKVMSLVSEIRRPSDGWSYERQRPVDPSCAPPP